MEIESYDYDYGLEEEDFYENNPPINKPFNARRVTFNTRAFAKVSAFKY